MVSTYDQYRFYAQDPAKSAQRIAAQPAVVRDTAYYRANIGKVRSVDDFIGDFRLFSYAMKSYGLEDSIANRGFMRKVLTSDLTDRKSFVNTLTDGRYRTFALAFSFTGTGKVQNAATAQDAAQQGGTLALFQGRTLAGQSKSADAAYYAAHIGQVTSVDALVSDSRLYRIALEAYGIDPNTTATDTVRHVLESDPFDPKSVVDTSGHPGDAAQSASDARSTMSRYASAAGSDAASQAAGAIESAYYGNAMPAVTTVDGFLSDDRLVAFATKAFGLDFNAPAVSTLAAANGADVSKPLTAAETSDILRAALTSDLSNPSSVARTLGGGFLAAAASFDFGATAIQSASGTADTTTRYGQTAASDAASQAAAGTETSYYASRIAAVKTADQFLADPRLVAYAAKAYGLTFPSGTGAAQQAATLRAALTGDPTDPKGAAATAGAPFVTFAEHFNSARVVVAQAADAAESTVDLYGQSTGQGADAADETRYYLDTMPGVKTADALVADSRLAAYVTKAYGIAVPAGATDAQKRAQLMAILVDDPATAANRYGDGARRLAGAFQFGVQGAVQQGRNAVAVSGLAPQPPAALQSTVDVYTERLGTDPAARLAGSRETAYYRTAVVEAGTVDDLVADPRVVAYLAAAYGLAFPEGADATDKANEMRAILTSAVGDPKSVASQIGDSARQLASAFTFNAVYGGDAGVGSGGRDAFVRLAAAFNFDGQGQVTNPRLAQSTKDTQVALAAYVRQAGTAGSRAATADAAYYTASIEHVKTLGGFLSDPRLVKVATAAFGITRPASLSDAAWTAQLRSVFASDVSDPKSAASRLGTAYRQMAAAFNFAADGTISRDPAELAQSRKAAVLLADPYVQQAMDDQAGAQNKAVGLALEFARKAPAITSAYQILADRSLLSVVQTAFNLPASMSSLDIDVQARIIDDAVKPADLHDPKKLATLLRNFAIRTDIDAAASHSPTSALGLDASGIVASSSSLLGVLHPATSAADTSSMPILQLFNPG